MESGTESEALEPEWMAEVRLKRGKRAEEVKRRQEQKIASIPSWKRDILVKRQQRNGAPPTVDGESKDDRVVGALREAKAALRKPMFGGGSKSPAGREEPSRLRQRNPSLTEPSHRSSRQRHPSWTSEGGDAHSPELAGRNEDSDSPRGDENRDGTPDSREFRPGIVASLLSKFSSLAKQQQQPSNGRLLRAGSIGNVSLQHPQPLKYSRQRSLDNLLAGDETPLYTTRVPLVKRLSSPLESRKPPSMIPESPPEPRARSSEGFAPPAAAPRAQLVQNGKSPSTRPSSLRPPTYGGPLVADHAIFAPAYVAGDSDDERTKEIVSGHALRRSPSLTVLHPEEMPAPKTVSNYRSIFESTKRSDPDRRFTSPPPPTNLHSRSSPPPLKSLNSSSTRRSHSSNGSSSSSSSSKTPPLRADPKRPVRISVPTPAPRTLLSPTSPTGNPSGHLGSSTIRSGSPPKPLPPPKPEAARRRSWDRSPAGGGADEQLASKVDGVTTEESRTDASPPEEADKELGQRSAALRKGSLSTAAAPVFGVQLKKAERQNLATESHNKTLSSKDFKSREESENSFSTSMIDRRDLHRLNCGSTPPRISCSSLSESKDSASGSDQYFRLRSGSSGGGDSVGNSVGNSVSSESRETSSIIHSVSSTGFESSSVSSSVLKSPSNGFVENRNSLVEVDDVFTPIRSNDDRLRSNFDQQRLDGLNSITDNHLSTDAFSPINASNASTTTNNRHALSALAPSSHPALSNILSPTSNALTSNNRSPTTNALTSNNRSPTTNALTSNNRSPTTNALTSNNRSPTTDRRDSNRNRSPTSLHHHRNGVTSATTSPHHHRNGVTSATTDASDYDDSDILRDYEAVHGTGVARTFESRMTFSCEAPDLETTLEDEVASKTTTTKDDDDDDNVVLLSIKTRGETETDDEDDDDDDDDEDDQFEEKEGKIVFTEEISADDSVPDTVVDSIFVTLSDDDDDVPSPALRSTHPPSPPSPPPPPPQSKHRSPPSSSPPTKQRLSSPVMIKKNDAAVSSTPQNGAHPRSDLFNDNAARPSPTPRARKPPSPLPDTSAEAPLWQKPLARHRVDDGGKLSANANIADIRRTVGTGSSAFIRKKRPNENEANKGDAARENEVGPRFLGEGVRVGRGALKSGGGKKLKISFDDNPTVFEYPSERFAILDWEKEHGAETSVSSVTLDFVSEDDNDDDDEERRLLKSGATVSGLTAVSLGAYSPKFGADDLLSPDGFLGGGGEDERAVIRPPSPPLRLRDDDDDDEDPMTIVPAGDGRGWSSSASAADMLF